MTVLGCVLTYARHPQAEDGVDKKGNPRFTNKFVHTLNATAIAVRVVSAGCCAPRVTRVWWSCCDVAGSAHHFDPVGDLPTVRRFRSVAGRVAPLHGWAVDASATARRVVPTITCA